MSDKNRTRTLRWQDPMVIVEAAKTMSGLERLQAIMRGDVPSAPMALLVGITLTECESGRVVFEGEPAEYHYNLAGVVHGGFACTLLDSALGCAVLSTLPTGCSFTTTDLHVRFLRALTKESGRVRCEARTLHVGKTIGAAEARVTDSTGRLCAHATAACAILCESKD